MRYMSLKTFREYRPEGEVWITLANGDYYPDFLLQACQLYGPVLARSGQLLRESHSSQDLFMGISAISESWMRTQLCRVFRKYVSPQTPVEMLKRKRAATKTCADFGYMFRNIVEVQKHFAERPMPDEALCALLWEYKGRGKKGYDLTEKLFEVLRTHYSGLTIEGPERAGQDVLLSQVFADYPKLDRPVDFVIRKDDMPVAVGFARYDSDRGGAQEDDRPGQYREVAQEILGYADTHGLPHLKIVFVNDGPGLLLGTMWNDYAGLEERVPDRVKVTTLRMVPERITTEWLVA